MHRPSPSSLLLLLPAALASAFWFGGDARQVDRAATAHDAAAEPPAVPADPSHTAQAELRRVADGRSDAAPVLQRWIGSGGVKLPPGTYRLESTVDVDLSSDGFVAVEGNGGARLIMAAPGPAIRLRGTHGGTADPPTFQERVWNRERMPTLTGLEIVGEHPEADGVEARGTMQLTLTRLLIRRVRHAVRLVDRNRNVQVSDCHFYDNRGVGVFYDRVNLHQSNISACHISYNQGGGIVVRGGDVRNIQISGCDIEANMSPAAPPTANVLFDCQDGTVAEAAIVGCTIQHSANAPQSANVRIRGTGRVVRGGVPTTFQCGHVTIADNVLSDVQTNLDLHGVRGATISGNTLWQGFTHNLVLSGCQQIVVQGNLCERNPLYGYTAESNNGVLIEGCQDVTLLGLHLQNVQRSPAGLVLRDCRRLHVADCTILDSENAGLLLDDVRQSRIADCFIRDDRDSHRPSPPIRIRGGGENHFLDNTWNGRPEGVD